MLPAAQREIGSSARRLRRIFHLLKNTVDFPLIGFQGNQSLREIWVWVKIAPGFHPGLHLVLTHSHIYIYIYILCSEGFSKWKVSFTRAACHALTALVGTDLPLAGQPDDPAHVLSEQKLKRSAPVQASAPRKKRKNRSKNRFEALGENEELAEVEATQASSEPAPGRPALVLAVLRAQELRTAIRSVITDFMRILVANSAIPLAF